jgi:ribosomal protein S18 acetylase RimI-like enzyme
VSERGTPPQGEIRAMSDADIASVREVIAGDEFLLQYDPYVYWVMRHNAPDLCQVYAARSQVLGYVAGIAPFVNSDTCLLWQIGVHRDFRRRGIANTLVGAFLVDAARLGFSKVQLTIDVRNEASRRLFHQVAERSSAVAEIANLGEIADLTPKEECWVLRLA